MEIFHFLCIFVNDVRLKITKINNRGKSSVFRKDEGAKPGAIPTKVPKLIAPELLFSYSPLAVAFNLF